MKIREINLTCSNSVGQNTLLAAEGFKIFQGENAKLLVSVPDGFDLSGAEKVRLVVKNYIGFGKVGKTTMAAKEINYSSDGTIFELTPANTSAPSGLYLASVKFLDSGGKILNASSGIMELVETDCSETFKPDVEIIDVIEEIELGRAAFASDLAEAEVKIQNAKSEISLSEQNAITSIGNAKSGAVSEITGAKLGAIKELNAAKENAKNEIDGWTDQSARLASLEENTANLQLDKANAGYLQFNKAKLATATNNTTTLPFTLCATYDCAGYPSGGLFSILTTHKIIGYAGSAAGSMSGFEFGFCYNQNWGATMFGAVLSTPDTVISTARHGYDIGVLTTTEALRAKFVGKHTFIASISADITNGAPQATLYLDGVPLTGLTNTIYNGGLQSAELGAGQGSIWSGTKRYFASDWIPTISNLKLSRLKIFNCVLPATSADDADGIGYTIADYAQGIDEPPTMQDPSATYRALLSLQNYTFDGEVLDSSGNGNHASITVSDGGSVKGLNDNAVEALYQKIASRISNAT